MKFELVGHQTVKSTSSRCPSASNLNRSVIWRFVRTMIDDLGIAGTMAATVWEWNALSSRCWVRVDALRPAGYPTRIN